MITGVTQSGFEFTLLPEKLNNYELLELLAELEENPLYLPKVVTLLLGQDQKERLFDHIRNEEGIVPTDVMGEEIKDIFTKSKVKNS